MDKRKWHLVYTKPQKETLAREHLERQQFRVYLPMNDVVKRVRGGEKKRTEPFFSRYLFVHLCAETDNWSPIRSTIGVAGLVRFGGVAATVPDEVVHLLLQREQQIETKHVMQQNFSEGERVRIMDGALAGYEAIFKASRSTDRALLLLDIANRHTNLVMKTEQLEKIAS